MRRRTYARLLERGEALNDRWERAAALMFVGILPADVRQSIGL